MGLIEKKKIIIIADNRKKRVNAAIKDTIKWLGDLVEICDNYSDLENFKLEEKIDYILVFGGDGLILATARALRGAKIPVIGVNFGKLGFLTILTLKKFQEEILKIIQGNHGVSARMMVDCKVYRDGKLVFNSIGLNDVVIKSGYYPRMLYSKILIDDAEITSYGGDGVIISTPAGTTAYTLSAGGPILTPSISALVITPICPHLLTLRPLVVSSSHIIKVKLLPPYPEKVFLTIDGQKDFSLEDKDEVKISKSKFNFYLVEIENTNFFKILREKLVWGECRVNLKS